MTKNIGKPCTGKPYARFDEGALRREGMTPGHVVAACGEASSQGLEDNCSNQCSTLLMFLAGKYGSTEAEVYPWEEPHIREDVKKNLPLRIPEPLYMKLKFIAENTPYSMNSFILERLTEQIEQEIAEMIGEG